MAVKEENILPKEFWDAFERGLFMSKISLKLSKRLACYREIVAGKVYIESLTKGKYKINILSIRNNFLITITTMEEEKLCGLLHHDLAEKKSEARYYKVSIRKNHPKALELIDRIIKEVDKKVKIERKEMLRGGIASSGPIKKIMISALWRDFISSENTLSSLEKAIIITQEVDLNVSTVVNYALISNYLDVQEEAKKARKLLLKQKYEIPDEMSTIKRKLGPYSLEEVKEIAKSFRELGNIKEVQKYWLKKYKYKIPASTIYSKAKEYKKWEKNMNSNRDYERDYDSKEILPDNFWKAFRHGIYPLKTPSNIAFHIEKYAEILKGLGYAQTIYRSNYVINIIAIKGAFFISMHSKGRYSKQIGTINYNPIQFGGGHKQELRYLENLINREHPIALKLLYKLVKESFDNHIAIDDRPIEIGSLAFEKPIKTITITVKWLEIRMNNSILALDSIAEQIALLVDLDPITVTIYGRDSIVKSVRSDVVHASGILLEKKHDITNLWLEQLNQYPSYQPFEIAEEIGLKLELEPITVVGYARFAENRLVKSQAINSLNPIMEKKHDITYKWLKLKKRNLSITTGQIIETIAFQLNLNPISVAGYARSSDNSSIKGETATVYNILMERRLNITKLWTQIRNLNPGSDIMNPVKEIAKLLGKSQISIASYGRSSFNDIVKSEAIRVYNILMERKYQITEKWLEISKNNLDLNPAEISLKIAQNLKKSPISISNYGISSHNDFVKSEASKAKYALSKLVKI